MSYGRGSIQRVRRKMGVRYRVRVADGHGADVSLGTFDSELEAQQLAQTPPPPTPAVQSQPEPVATTTVDVKRRAAKQKKKHSSLPRGLAKAQDNVRATELALEERFEDLRIGQFG